MLDQHILPVKLLCARSLVILFQQRQKLFGKYFRKEHWPVHNPGIVPADLDMRNASFLIIGKTPLRSISFHIRRSIPGTTFIGVEHIVAQPVIRRKNVHIFPGQDLPCPVDGS